MTTIDIQELDQVTGGRKIPRVKPSTFRTAVRIGGKIWNGVETAMNVGFTGLMALQAGQMAYDGVQWLRGKGGSDQQQPAAPAAPQGGPG